jgi:hypothetical protein
LTEPNNELLLYFRNSKFGQFINYIRGDPLLDKDLKRTDIAKAKACIILTSDKNVRDQHEADYRNILIALAVKKYVYMAP